MIFQIPKRGHTVSCFHGFIFAEPLVLERAPHISYLPEDLFHKMTSLPSTPWSLLDCLLPRPVKDTDFKFRNPTLLIVSFLKLAGATEPFWGSISLLKETLQNILSPNFVMTMNTAGWCEKTMQGTSRCLVPMGSQQMLGK